MIQWFPFLAIVEHTAHTLKPNKGLIPSLLKVFAIFQLNLFYDRHNEEGNVVGARDIRCTDCNKETGLYLKDTTIEEIITKFVLNSILHHVCML